MSIHPVRSSDTLLQLLRESDRPLRISILGACGSGKSTLAEHLARELAVPAYHLDEFFWLPGWAGRSDPDMAKMIREVIKQNRWIIDGNYTRFQPIIRERVEVIIWLNYGFWTTFRQLWQRTIPRARARAEVFPGCRNSLRQQFADRNSIFMIFLRIFWRHRRRNRAFFDQPAIQQRWMLIEVNDPRHVHFSAERGVE